MQEYWVNVYEPFNWTTSLISTHQSRDSAINHNLNAKCLYRIHVKMKPVVPHDVKESYERFFQR